MKNTTRIVLIIYLINPFSLFCFLVYTFIGIYEGLTNLIIIVFRHTDILVNLYNEKIVWINLWLDSTYNLSFPIISIYLIIEAFILAEKQDKRGK